MAASALVGPQGASATIDHTASDLLGKPTTVQVWTIPLPGTDVIPTGGYVDKELIFLSPDLLSSLHRLAAHKIQKRGPAMVEAGWAVLTLGHEVAHLRGVNGELEADQWGVAHAAQLVNLLGVHGQPARLASNAAALAHIASTP